mmetsp:Transcript_57287/g.123958  ORF Transcript_57287/g.123958 Transcript_57287/m.123958 type:complete len:262 (-) Transcript_57287:104-889(-)
MMLAVLAFLSSLVAAGALRVSSDQRATALPWVHKSAPPCQCDGAGAFNIWKSCNRTVPKCVFIDLGAADGNTFRDFLNNTYGPVAGCPSGTWEAFLVEANPRFNEPLQQVASHPPGKIAGMTHVESSTAAYMCEATTSFYLDTANAQTNYWGSSMSDSHPDVKKSGFTKVTVPTVNLNRILFEHTIPGDWVMVKMDIEGSEFDVLPCLAKSPAASLIDRLYMEQHDPSWGMSGTTLAEMEAAKAELKQRGVDIPPYFSQTL